MAQITRSETINGHLVTVGYAPYADDVSAEFPWIQIDDSPRYFADTDGDHWGNIGIDNPDDFKGTILESFISYNEDSGYWEFDMGGMFFCYDNNRTHSIDYDELILTPLGMIDNGEGAYGNG